MKSPAEYYRIWYYKNQEKARAQKAANMKRYRAENPEKHRKISRDTKARMRLRLLAMYGEKCVLCGFADNRALSLDHINGNGNEERRQFGERGVYQRALANYLPNEYRTLCMNCQFVEREKRKEWLQQHGDCSSEK